MDQLQSMQTFVRVAEAGSFARAAAVLGLSSAAAAQAVNDLEAHLGTALLRRSGGWALTPTGQHYLAHSRDILAQLALADGQAREGWSPAEHRGTLRVQVPMGFAVHQLAKHLPVFHAQYPNMAVELSAPALDSAGAHDLAIHWPTLPQRQSSRTHRLARSDVVLCAAPEYLDRHGRPETPDLLGQHRLLLTAGPDARGKPVELWRGRAVRPSRVLCLNHPVAPVITAHPEMAYAAALAGQGICGLPSFMVEDAVVEGALERVLPDWRLGHLSLWVNLSAPRANSPLAQALLGFLLELYGGQDRDPWLNPADGW